MTVIRCAGYERVKEHSMSEWRMFFLIDKCAHGMEVLTNLTCIPGAWLEYAHLTQVPCTSYVNQAVGEKASWGCILCMSWVKSPPVVGKVCFSSHHTGCQWCTSLVSILATNCGGYLLLVAEYSKQNDWHYVCNYHIAGNIGGELNGQVARKRWNFD